MPIAYPDILNLEFEPEVWSWTERDSQIYALSVGCGANPDEGRDLPFVFEGLGLQTLTSIVTVVGASAQLGGKKLGTQRLKRVHGAQSAVYHASLPAQGSAVSRTRIAACYDKGPDVGALIISETTVSDAASGAPYATMTMTTFARADGGFGGPDGGIIEYFPPRRPPDVSVDVPTRPNQALLFRLLRDRNPLHADPARAAAAGFPRPILHGMCLFGVAYRTALATFGEFSPGRIASQDCRFSAPVFPGEVLAFDFWRDGSEVRFEARVQARGVAVLRHGRFVLKD